MDDGTLRLKGLSGNVIPFNKNEREKFYEEKHHITKKAFNIAKSLKIFKKKDGG